MKKPTISASSNRAIVSLLILVLTASCFSFKPIVKYSTNPVTDSELESRISPEKIYKIVLKKQQIERARIEDVFVKIKKITTDTVFCDVKKITVTHISSETGAPETNFYNNISCNGSPTNNKWFWGDPAKRLIGLGHISINSIAEVKERKYSAGKTTALVTSLALAQVLILAISVSNSTSLNFSGATFPPIHP